MEKLYRVWPVSDIRFHGKLLLGKSVDIMACGPIEAVEKAAIGDDMVIREWYDEMAEEGGWFVYKYKPSKFDVKLVSDC